MPYTTGTASSGGDFLNTLRVALLAKGWTVNKWSDDGTGKRLHANLGYLFINMRSVEAETIVVANQGINCRGIAMYLSTGYDGSKAWNLQPGARTVNLPNLDPMLVFSDNFGPIPSYHLFTYADSDDVNVVLEISSGRFLHFGFGTVKHYDSGRTDGQWLWSTQGFPNVFNAAIPNIYNQPWYPGSTNHSVEFMPFAFGSRSDASSERYCSSHLKVDDLEGLSNFWHSGEKPRGAQGANGVQRFLMEFSNVQWNHLAVLTKIPLLINRTASLTTPFGELRNIRTVRLDQRSVGDEVSFGPDTWKLFPIMTKSNVITGEYGLAYLKT